MNIQTIEDVSDAIPLYIPQSLYLKPIARLHMSVALPSKITGKAISNYDIMERMRNIILPDRFSLLRVNKGSILFDLLFNLYNFRSQRVQLSSYDLKLSSRPEVNYEA